MIEVIELVIAEDIAIDIFRTHFGKGCLAKVSADGK